MIHMIMILRIMKVQLELCATVSPLDDLSKLDESWDNIDFPESYLLDQHLLPNDVIKLI